MKDFSGGSGLRIREPDETFAIAKRVLPRVGISRVTDITRMDRLGLPVFASIRPRALTSRVHAGKGLTAGDARIGAAMEGIELAVAEPEATTWRGRRLSAATLSSQLGPGLSLVDLRPLHGVTFPASEKIVCVRCDELGSERTAFLPAQLVFFPCVPEGTNDLFGGSSNGLASGNSVDEATLHALLEIMERDAFAMNEVDDASEWIAPDRFPSPFDALSAQWREIGVHLQVRHVPNAFGLPCFEARIHEPASEDVNLVEGRGLHLDRSIAFNRAACEAAQSRLSIIHGGRDDVTRFYEKYRRWLPADRTAIDRALIARFTDSTRSTALSSIPTVELAKLDVASAVRHVREILHAAGFPAVFRYRFDADLSGLQVVRVVVPRSEHIEHGQKRIGPRLLARILEHA